MPKETLLVESRAAAAAGVRILRLSGSLTLACCYQVQDKLRSNPEESLIVDMTEVRFVDSSGLGSLVNGYIAHHMAGSRVLLAGLGKRVRETLEETRVQQFFTIFDTVEEAEKELLSKK
ncbi:MAG: STAS domain-containing protein [Terriglobales bacterium]